MSASSSVSTPPSDSPVAARLDRSRRLDPRAVFRGAMVGAGGGLVFSTLIGVTAVLAMASNRHSAQTIAAQLRSQWDLRIALALVELLMAMLAGYTAAITAGRGRFWHALLAGAVTLAMNLVVVAVCGSSLPWPLAAAGMALTLPLAAFGGYLASPRPSPASPDSNASAVTGPKL